MDGLEDETWAAPDSFGTGSGAIRRHCWRLRMTKPGTDTWATGSRKSHVTQSCALRADSGPGWAAGACRAAAASALRRLASAIRPASAARASASGKGLGRVPVPACC